LIARTANGFIRTRLSDDLGPWLTDSEADDDGSSDTITYTPENIDRRPLVERAIRERRGQQGFRESLRSRYGDQCLVTGCKVLAILEAAHINPYRGQTDHHVENGLLLRADIHTLFDLDLLGVEPNHLRVEVHPAIDDEYGGFSGRRLLCRADRTPSLEQLEIRYQAFRERKRLDVVANDSTSEYE
jgi:hypothetical protein